LVGALTVSITLIGCTAEPDARIQLPEQNIDSWVMPLDDFKWVGIARSGYAELVLIGPCMTDAGLPWDLPPWEERQPSESFNAAMIKLNNEELSSRWGYHLAPTAPTVHAAEWTSLDESLTALNPDDYAIFEGCREAAREVLPIVSNLSNFATSLEFTAYDEAAESDEVEAASERWAECMAPLGIADLPKSPEEMPSMSMIAAFDLSDPNSQVTGEERSAAVADSACRRSSGYREVFYKAVWDAQVELLEENSDTLFRNRELLEEHYDQVTEIMTQYVSNN
jgi:hypothetical protein